MPTSDDRVEQNMGEWQCVSTDIAAQGLETSICGWKCWPPIQISPSCALDGMFAEWLDNKFWSEGHINIACLKYISEDDVPGVRPQSIEIHDLKRWLECRGCINENNIVIEEAEEVVIQSAIQEDVKSHRCILRLFREI